MSTYASGTVPALKQTSFHGNSINLELICDKQDSSFILFISVLIGFIWLPSMFYWCFGHIPHTRTHTQTHTHTHVHTHTLHTRSAQSSPGHDVLWTNSTVHGVCVTTTGFRRVYACVPQPSVRFKSQPLAKPKWKQVVEESCRVWWRLALCDL